MRGRGAKIGATVGVILVGLGAGPVAAFAMAAHLESSGALDSEWALGYLGHVLVAFVVGGVVGCGGSVSWPTRIPAIRSMPALTTLRSTRLIVV